MTRDTPTVTPEREKAPRSWKRLVYVTRLGKTYHHRPHHDHYMVTWTQRFAHNGLGYEPCRTCFKGTRPRHNGRLVEAQGQLGWASSRPEAIGSLQ